MLALASTSRGVPDPVRLREPARRAPSVPVRTSEELDALVRNANCCADLSNPKKPIFAEARRNNGTQYHDPYRR